MNIFAVIVTFNCEILNLKNLIKSLISQKVSIIVVDNNSNENLDLNDLDITKLIKLDKNYGIAKAQNIGISFSIDLGAEYIIFFDQDSTIPNTFISDISFDYFNLKKNDINVGLIGPRFIDKRNNLYQKSIDYSSGKRKYIDVSRINSPVRSTLIISSGTFVSTSTICQIGLLKEEYFIDYVDTEWCFRAENLGFSNFVSSSALMFHEVGDGMIKNRFFQTPLYSPFRRYYIARNAFFMLDEKHIPTSVALRQILVNFFQQIIILLYSKNKFLHFRFFFKGIFDGLKKIMKRN